MLPKERETPESSGYTFNAAHFLQLTIYGIEAHEIHITFLQIDANATSIESHATSYLSIPRYSRFTYSRLPTSI